MLYPKKQIQLALNAYHAKHATPHAPVLKGTGEWGPLSVASWNRYIAREKTLAAPTYLHMDDRLVYVYARKLLESAGIELPPPWFYVAESLIGQREIKGPKHNPLILRMWDAIGAKIRDDETPWCAGYVGYCLDQCGLPNSRSAAARSYQKYGRKCEVQVGAIAVLSRPPSNWSGHVGIVVGKTKDGGLLLNGGNQGDAVSIAKFDPKRVLDYRWPSDWPQANPFARGWGKLPVFASAGAYSTNEA